MFGFPFGPRPERPFFRGHRPPFPRGCGPGWFDDFEEPHNARFRNPFGPRPPFPRGPHFLFRGPHGMRPHMPFPPHMRPRGHFGGGMRMDHPMNRDMYMMDMEHPGMPNDEDNDEDNDEAPSIEVTPLMPSKKHAKKPCPFKGCNHETQKIKWHAYCHFPRYFFIPTSGHPMFNNESRLKVAGLRLIAQLILGKEATLEGLVDYVNQNCETKDFHISEEIRRETKRIIKQEKWASVKLSMNPINSQALLIHWQILAFLFNNLDNDQQMKVWDLDKKVEDSPAQSTTLPPAPSSSKTQAPAPPSSITQLHAPAPGLTTEVELFAKCFSPPDQAITGVGDLSELEQIVFGSDKDWTPSNPQDRQVLQQQCKMIESRDLREPSDSRYGVPIELGSDKGWPPSNPQDRQVPQEQHKMIESSELLEPSGSRYGGSIELEDLGLGPYKDWPLSNPQYLHERQDRQDPQRFEFGKHRDPSDSVLSHVGPGLGRSVPAAFVDPLPSIITGERVDPETLAASWGLSTSNEPYQSYEPATKRKRTVQYDIAGKLIRTSIDPLSTTMICPIIGCTAQRQTNQMKWHVYNHLPSYFYVPKHGDPQSDKSELKVHGLRLIAHFLVGKDATIESLREYVNQICPITEFNISDEIAIQMKKISALENWPEVPMTRTIDYINSRALLIHWHVLAYLYNMLTKDQKNQLHTLEEKLKAIPVQTVQLSAPPAHTDPILASWRTIERAAVRQYHSNVGTQQDSVNQLASYQSASAGNVDKGKDLPFNNMHVSGGTFSTETTCSQLLGQRSCPVRGCSHVTTEGEDYMMHVNLHLPTYFQSDMAQDPISDEKLLETVQLQVKGLRLISLFLFGGGATLDKLTTYVNQHLPFSDIRIPFNMQRCMEQMIFLERWEKVTPCVYPMNTPAVLIHWQIVVFLMNQLSSDQWKQLYDLQPEFEDIPEPSSPPPPPTPLPGFDAHFYPESLSKKMSKDKDGVNLTAGRDPDHPVDIVGGVSNYSNPDFFASEQFDQLVLAKERSSTWKIAVGINPKLASSVTSKQWTRLVQCLSHPKVVAISDIGFDFLVSSDKWRDQEHLFRRILDLGTTGYVLVMFLRGTREDVQGVVVHKLSRTLIKQKCSKHQRIHLHSFESNVEQVKAWTETYPNCYFGITGSVRSFSPGQIKALKEIPLDRLLLETCAPFQKLYPEVRYNTSAFLADLGKLVADIRGVSLEFLMEVTLANSLRLYGA